MNKVVQFALAPIGGNLLPPQTRLRWREIPTFWKLLELPFRQGLRLWLLGIAKAIGRAAIEEYSVYPEIPVTGYRRERLDFDDIVEQAMGLSRAYQRRTGSKPELLCVGYPQLNDLDYAVQCRFPHNFESSMRYRDRGTEIDSGRYFAGMRVTLCPDIDGIVVLGAAELSDRR